MGTNDKLLDFSALKEMLYGEQKYITEFAEAAKITFSEFSEDYQKHLMNRDEANFRRAGHKIKPVALMLGLNQIVKEYEHGKTLLWDEKPDEELEISCKKIRSICHDVMEELREISGKE